MNYEDLHLTWKMIDSLQDMFYKAHVNLHNREAVRRYAKKNAMAEIEAMLDGLSHNEDAKQIWEHIICDIENGFSMPYVQ